MADEGQCTKCGAEPRQGTHRWGKACLKAYRAERKARGLPEAGDLATGERPADPGPKRERRDPKSPGRVAHERGARGETKGPEGETPWAGDETKGPAVETIRPGGETAPAVKRCTRHGKRIWVEGLVRQAMDCVEPRCREEAFRL